MHSMEQQLAEQLTQRLLKLVNQKAGDLTDQVLEVPSSFYTDEAQWRAECRLMENVPAIATPTAMLRENNRYIAKTVNNHRRILITRDNEGLAHVFLNACRHRGSLLVEDGEGCQERFSCPYHNWTYASNGALKGIPFQEGFNGVDRASHGLIELPSKEMYGMVWYYMNPRVEPDFDAWFGDFGAELAQWNYADFEYISHRHYEVRANWKNALEAFTEFYHFEFVHANSLVGQGTISNICGFDSFGYHSRMLSALRTITELDADPDQAYFGSQHMGVIYSIFPNLIIANSPIGLEFLHFMPGSAPDKGMLYYVGMSNMRIQDDETMAGYKSLFEQMQQVVEEDVRAMTACTTGLNNGLPGIVIGRNEPGTQHFIQSIYAASAPFLEPQTGSSGVSAG